MESHEKLSDCGGNPFEEAIEGTAEEYNESCSYELDDDFCELGYNPYIGCYDYDC